MDIKRLLLAALIFIPFLPFSAQAEPMNFAYLQATGLVNTELEFGGVSADGNGLGIRGSWIYGPYVFSDFRFDDADLNRGTSSQYFAGRLGLRTALDIRKPMRMDIYAMITAEDIDLERRIGGTTTNLIDNTGAGVVVGGRFGPFYPIEVGAEYSYTDFGQNSSQFFSVEGIWNASNWLGIVLEYRNGTYELNTRPDIDRTDVNLGIRLQFGGDDI